MRKPLRLLLAVLLQFTYIYSNAQCGAGTSPVSLNWDALDYIPTTGYSNSVATALSPNQFFAFGKNRLNVSYTTTTSAGENASHSGETGSYGVGQDVQYNGNGSVTISFATTVFNVKFSIYDIDKGQTIAFSALNSGVNTPLTLTKANTASTDITISGQSVSSGATKSDAANTNTVNIDIVGPLTSVTMIITNSGTGSGGPDNNFWLSDISACQASSFPADYYAISRPFTGQPGYVLVAANKSVYKVDPATGNASFIFSDGASSGTVNSLAYDPYNKIVYYCWSLTNNGSANSSERTLRKYDFNTGVTTVLLNDITSLGIPTFDQGVESGAAAFYDGALYIGIEGGADNTGGGPKVNTNKESIIWRLDFTAGVPASATQVFAVSGDIHDWSDFSIFNGMLYDANGDAGNEDYHHFDMQTGGNTLVNFVSSSPKQKALGWDGTIYRVSTTIAQYNMAGGVGTQYPITANPAIPNFGTSGSPTFGDAAEAYRPDLDFGDAPASYDPDALAPAVHDMISTLKLGSNQDLEWSKTSSANADADGGDEDALPYVQLYSNTGTYLTEANVFNNTGANATVCAWADFNNNGIFESGEGITQTIATSTTQQTINLFWSGISEVIPDGSYIYLRIRITSASNAMGLSNATGYFSNGEVEDYRVLVTFAPLAVRVTDFKVTKISEEKVEVKWTSLDDEKDTRYDVERSFDGRNWVTIHRMSANNDHHSVRYTYTDPNPLKPTSYYRVKYSKANTQLHFTPIQKVNFNWFHSLNVFPNPVTKIAFARFITMEDQQIQLSLVDVTGSLHHSQNYQVRKGENTIALLFVEQLPAGRYALQLKIKNEIQTQQLIINR